MNNRCDENNLILQLCKIYTYDKEKIQLLLNSNLDYPYILGQLLYNRLGGVAYTILRECDLLKELNREFRNSLEIVYNYNCIKQDSFCKTLDMLSAMFKSVDVSYALLKGAFLINVYDIGMRTSNDVDILVNQNQISEITDILKKNGFIQGNTRGGKFTKATRFEILSSRLNRGETVPFIKEVDYPFLKYLEVDINFSMDYKSDVNNNHMVEEFLKNTEMIIKTKQGYLPSLNRVYFFLQLCLHLYKEATVLNWVKMGRDVSLYKYMDIEVFIDKFFNMEFVNELITIVENLGLERECYYVLFYTKLLFSTRNENLDFALQSIIPNNLEYLCQIIDPENQKVYRFNEDYIDWIFSINKMEKLYEVGNG